MPRIPSQVLALTLKDNLSEVNIFETLSPHIRFENFPFVGNEAGDPPASYKDWLLILIRPIRHGR